MRIRGIGDFWSQGICLRGCGVVDVFPDEPLSVAALTDRLRPYRMWACFLLRVAAGQGLVPGVAGRGGAIRRPAGSPGRWPDSATRPGRVPA